MKYWKLSYFTIQCANEKSDITVTCMQSLTEPLDLILKTSSTLLLSLKLMLNSNLMLKRIGLKTGLHARHAFLIKTFYSKLTLFLSIFVSLKTSKHPLILIKTSQWFMTNFVISPLRNLLITSGSFEQKRLQKTSANEQYEVSVYVLKKKRQYNRNVMNQIMFHIKGLLLMRLH